MKKASVIGFGIAGLTASTALAKSAHNTLGELASIKNKPILRTKRK